MNDHEWTWDGDDDPRTTKKLTSRQKAMARKAYQSTGALIHPMKFTKPRKHREVQDAIE